MPSLQISTKIGTAPRWTMAAAEAIASTITSRQLQADYIIPSVFNRNVAPAVARGVARAARASGVARRSRGH